MRVFTVLVLLAVVIVSTGCNKTNPPAMKMDDVSGSEYAQKVALDNLEHHVVYQAPRVFPETEDTPFRVVVAVRNISKKELNVQYKFVFYNKDGVPAGDDFGWRFKTLPVKARVHIEGTALQKNIADWDLIIRSAR